MSEEKSEKLEKVGNFVSSTFNKIINLIIFLIIIGLIIVIGWFWHESQMNKQEMKSLKKENMDLREELEKSKIRDLKVKKESKETMKDESIVYFKDGGELNKEMDVNEYEKNVNNNELSSNLVEENKENSNSNNEFNDWQTYNNGKITFKYPKGWYIKEEKSTGRIYVKNTNIDISKANIPENFQQIWFSTLEQEVKDEFQLEYSYITTVDGIKIKFYNFVGEGGPLMRAYWQDNSGKKYSATNSSEVGEELQNEMIKNLKKILSTFRFVK